MPAKTENHCLCFCVIISFFATRQIFLQILFGGTTFLYKKRVRYTPKKLKYLGIDLAFCYFTCQMRIFLNKTFWTPNGSPLTKKINNHAVSHVFWLLDWCTYSLINFCLFVDDERNNNQLWQTVQEQIGGCSGAGGRTSGTPAYIFFSSAPPQILVLVIFGLFMVFFQFAIVTKLAYFREEVNRKKTFSFGHCPNDGGGGSTHARIFWPSF